MELLRSGTVQLTFATAAVVVGTTALVRLYLKRKKAAKRKTYPRNVVVLHQFPYPMPDKPTLSPFCLKIETWYIHK
jgi:hypothetical protein